MKHADPYLTYEKHLETEMKNGDPEYIPFLRLLYDSTSHVKLRHLKYHSVFSFMHCRKECRFIVLWDEDKDTRVMWHIYKLMQLDMLHMIESIAERKGTITISIKDRFTCNNSLIYRTLELISDGQPGDWFYIDQYANNNTSSIAEDWEIF